MTNPSPDQVDTDATDQSDPNDESVTPDTTAEGPTRVQRIGRAIMARLPRISMAILSGLLLCASFPPFGLWYAAFGTFALLAWVLTRPSTRLVGGFGYGLLFGLAFYIPLLPWTGGLVGLFPWLALQ